MNLRNGEWANGRCGETLMMFEEMGNRTGVRPIPMEVAPAELPRILRWRSYKYLSPTEHF
jgi:hypothetical protein